MMRTVMDGNEAARMELKLMPIDTVCDTVGVSPATLYRLIAAGRFRHPSKSAFARRAGAVTNWPRTSTSSAPSASRSM